MKANRMLGVVRVRHGDYVCALAPGVPDATVPDLVAALDRRPSREGPGVLGGRSSVWHGTLPTVGHVVVKEYRRGGRWRYVMRRRYLRLGETRPERELHNLYAVRIVGLSAPEPLAALWRGGLFYRGWLVMRPIDGASLVEVGANGGEALPALMDELSRQVMLLIGSRIKHHDLHPGNVLADEHGGIHLVDFDKATSFFGPVEVLQRHYQLRWRRAVVKYGLPAILSSRFDVGLSDGASDTSAPAPPPQIPKAGSVLVVLMGSLGDVIRGLPLVSILKQHRPDCRVTWLADARWKDLVALHPGVDRVLVFPRERRVRDIPALVAELRSAHFDVTLDLQRHFKSGACSWLSGARRRIGFHPRNAKEFNHLFNNEYIGSCPAAFSKLRHYLKFAELLHLPLPDLLDFGLERLKDPDRLPPSVAGISGSFAAVVVGSSWRSKNWSAERYVEFITRLLTRTGLRVVLLGDESQRTLAADIEGAVKDSRIVNLVAGTSLIELGAVLSAARVAVGPDSGPGHLAAAVGTPYIGLFGPTDPRRVAPYRSVSLAVQSPVPCPPCGRRMCTRKEGDCMTAITAEMVWQTVESQLDLVAECSPPAMQMAESTWQ